MAEFKYLDQGNSEVQDKQAEAYQYAPSGTTGIAATGVIEGLVVRQTSTASDSVLIDAGACLNQASLGQGADRLINPSQKTLDIFTNDPMDGLPRNDIIAFDSITTAIVMIKGDANASPGDPTVPATSVALARLRHAASATTIPTAKIDNLIVATTLRGAGIPDGLATQTLLYTPAGNNDTPGSGTTTWFTLGNITVPPWATAAVVIYAIVGVFNGALGTNASCVVKIGTVSGAVSKRISDPDVINQRFPITVADKVIGLTPGVKSVTMSSTYGGGGGSYRIDTYSYVTAAFTFLP